MTYGAALALAVGLALPVAMAPMNIAGGLCAALTLLVWLTRAGPRWEPRAVHRDRRSGVDAW